MHIPKLGIRIRWYIYLYWECCMSHTLIIPSAQKYILLNPVYRFSALYKRSCMHSPTLPGVATIINRMLCAARVRASMRAKMKLSIHEHNLTCCFHHRFKAWGSVTPTTIARRWGLGEGPLLFWIASDETQSQNLAFVIH